MKCKQHFTLSQKVKLLRNKEKLENKAKKYNYYLMSNMKEIRRLRDLLDEHRIIWRQSPEYIVRPYKKSEEKNDK